MPGSMFCSLDGAGSSSGFEDPRTFQLALELSRLGGFSDAGGDAPPTPGSEPDHVATPFVVEESRNKKSQNMTECVPVPSSEHVAEIVGRQGCKIKALRAKTNTYIKTPVRGEEPVFVVTGRKEDVAKAKREILSAAEHFSQIRASRKNNLSGSGGSLSPPGPPANLPADHITIQVRVPYRVVGLVVGPKGATIKRIQHQTHTYIVTPSRDKEPVFDVTGLPESVATAKREIESHIAVRTGAGNMPDNLFADTFLTPDTNNLLLNSVYKAGFGSIFSCMDNLPSDVMFPSTLSGSSGCSSASSSSSATGLDLGSIWGTSLDRDEGLGDSPTTTSSIWSFGARPSPAHSASPAESLSGKRECLVCGDREVTAALVPCGHNLFCYECAIRLCATRNPCCPACHQTVVQPIRILS